MKLDRIRPDLIPGPVGSRSVSRSANRMSIYAMEQPNCLPLFHPASGRVRVKGVTSSANVILHPWLKSELSMILETIPAAPQLDAETNRELWKTWQAGLSQPISLPQELPVLRMLLIWDNLRGHYTPELVLWLFAHGIMPLYTPLGGSWLNMAESMQRILSQRGLAGQHPETPSQIIALLEGVAKGWNRNPTPFDWGVNALRVVNAAVNGDMLWVGQGLALSDLCVDPVILSRNGSYRAKRPTSALLR